jgi:5-formyltetrahydrofolate cyclo-ligase
LELLAEVLANAPPSAAIGLYAPVRGEVDVLPLLADIVSHGWMAALPRVEGPGDMAFRQITRVDELRPGAYGIPEPGPDCPRVAPVDLTALIVPGVAFARDGRRLGYGGGYYDRWLAAEQVRAVRIGIAFELQVLDELPAEAHDVRMHYLVTERGVFRCGGQP